MDSQQLCCKAKSHPSLSLAGERNKFSAANRAEGTCEVAVVWERGKTSVSMDFVTLLISPLEEFLRAWLATRKQDLCEHYEEAWRSIKTLKHELEVFLRCVFGS